VDIDERGRGNAPINIRAGVSVSIASIVNSVNKTYFLSTKSARDREVSPVSPHFSKVFSLPEE